MIKMEPNLIVVVILILYFAFEFLKVLQTSKDKRLITAGLISNILLLLFLLLFLLDVKKQWIYLAIIAGIIPGIYFMVLRYKASPKKGIINYIPEIVSIALIIYILIIL